MGGGVLLIFPPQQAHTFHFGPPPRMLKSGSLTPSLCQSLSSDEMSLVESKLHAPSEALMWGPQASAEDLAEAWGG